ncbi:MAG: hypothetical protein R3D85_09715 [Paracoccaceae bacterium]
MSMAGKGTGFDDLVADTDAVYQADLARLRTIAAEEARLRAELAQLAEDERRNAAANPEDIAALNRIGGDVLWKAWIGRKREALNRQLATVMALKLTAARQLRHSFGKTSVAEELRDRDRQQRRGDKATRRLAEEQAQMLLKAGTTRPGGL